MALEFSIGDVLSLIDKTLLNPFLSAAIPFALHYLTPNKFVVTKRDGIIPYSIATPLPSLLYKSLLLLGFGIVLRVNRVLCRRALNNGVSARFTWDNEIIVVTGASGGIGAEAAKKLSARGSKVVVIDVIPLTFPKPKNLYYYKCDLTDFKALQEVKTKIENEVGIPTCVVANAGICRGKSLFDATQRDIELTFGVNNFGLIWTAKTFLPAMAANNHGHFLIIASQTGFLTNAGIVDYSATKAAAISIYEGIQTEMKHFYKAPAVRISCISPGAVKTKMFAGLKGESNFFLPRLTPEYLGGLIAETLWSGTAQNIMTPVAAYIVAPAKVLPAWLRVGFQDGGSGMMTELTPHKPLE